MATALNLGVALILKTANIEGYNSVVVQNSILEMIQILLVEGFCVIFDIFDEIFYGIQNLELLMLIKWDLINYHKNIILQGFSLGFCIFYYKHR